MHQQKQNRKTCKHFLVSRVRPNKTPTLRVLCYGGLRKGHDTGTAPLRAAGAGARPTGREALAAIFSQQKNIPALMVGSPGREGGGHGRRRAAQPRSLVRKQSEEPAGMDQPHHLRQRSVTEHTLWIKGIKLSK